MKGCLLAIVIALLFLTSIPPAFSEPVSDFNATITQDEVFYMREPSFAGRDSGIFEMGGVGSRVIVLSRTSFTDRMMGVPEDYWYLVMYMHCGAKITGYIHGSALRMDPGSTVPVSDPPGAAPSTTAPAFERLTVSASIDETCIKTTGAITVPPGKRAVRFRLNWFNSGYSECPGEFSGQIIAFSIAPASDPGNPSFAYEEPEDPGPDEFNEIRDEFFSLELGPGAYRVDIEGRPWIRLKITYDLAEDR